jgi:exopolysaccharide biosynthesis polyprenyl glycosylphosphotransferase
MSQLSDRVVRYRRPGAGRAEEEAAYAGPEHEARVAPALRADGPARAARERAHRLERRQRRYIGWRRIADACVALTAALGCYLLYIETSTPARIDYLVLSLCFPLVWLMLVSIGRRTYEQATFTLGAEEFRRVVRAGLVVAVAVSLVQYVLGIGLAREYFLVLILMTTAGSLGVRLTARLYLQRRRAAGSGPVGRVVVAGHDEEVRRVLRELGRSRWHGYEVAGVCIAESASDADYRVPVARGLESIAESADRAGADAVIVVPCQHFDGADLRRLGWHLETTGTQLLVVPRLVDVASHRTRLHSVGTLPLVHVDHPELTGLRRLGKDLFDRTVAGLALVTAAPVLLMLMVAVRLDSDGPALFRQERVGRDDRRFPMIKLRTMVVDAEARRRELEQHNESDGALFKLREDPRVTRLGRVLRRYSLDELPQLVNVLLGHMSLVGPRPPLPAEVDSYERDARRRLAVKPGLTGLWQVSGRSDLPWEEAVRLDLHYVDNWSPMLDLSILWRTASAVLSKSGAY